MERMTFVGPVADRSMARAFEDVGVSVVGVMPSSLPSIPSRAPISSESAEAIREGLRSAEVCLMWNAGQGTNLLRQWCHRLRPDYVLVDWRQCEAERVIPTIEEIDARVILVGAALDYDEDPTWAEDRIRRLLSQWNPSRIVLTLFPTVEGWPVGWLRTEAGKYEDDVALGDVQRLLGMHPLLLNVRLENSRELDWVRDTLPSGLGLGFFLNGEGRDGGSPVMSDADHLLDVLEAGRERDMT